jgi:hypothetical protein
MGIFMIIASLMTLVFIFCMVDDMIFKGHLSKLIRIKFGIK